MNGRAEDPQLAALRAFTFLLTLRQLWAGRLILAEGLAAGGEELSIAANIAGAGFLAVEARPQYCRSALRSGACDFLVNSVDEALRVLKNEIRKRKPISVALCLNEESAFGELSDRGVQPDLFAAFGGTGSEGVARHFGRLGAAIATFAGDSRLGVDAGAAVDAFAAERGLEAVVVRAESAEQMREHDMRMLELLPADDSRRPWVASASRFFHRERPYRRVMFLSAEERKKMGV